MHGAAVDVELVTVDEFIRRVPGMKLTRSAAWRMCRLNQLPNVRIGRKVYVNWTAFQKLAQDGRK